MFNDRYGLTQAVIEGRKTMTRRVISGGQLLPEDRIEDASICPDGFVSIIANGGESLMEVKCHYKVGEIVAVAQRYYYVVSSGCDIPVDGMDRTPGWRNKMFVRADLMPHQIRITGIKCERLQDISEADCLKEGIRQAYAESILGMYGYIDHKGTGLWFNTPREAFASLIDKVSGRGTWDRNPWVVVYEFELVK